MSGMNLSLSAYLPFNDGDTFCLPIFSKRNACDGYFIQIPDAIEKEKFLYRRISDDSVESAELLEGQNMTNADNIIYIFRKDGCLTIGSYENFLSRASQMLNDYENNPCIFQQIAEMFGSPQIKRYARAKMRQHLRDTVGEKAASAYHEGSVLRSVFWDVLLEIAPTKTIAERILNSKDKIDVTVEAGEIKINIVALQEDLYDENTDEKIVNLIKEQFNPNLQNVDFSMLINMNENKLLEDVTTVNLSSIRISQLVSNIRRSSRQEERLILFMKYIMDYPNLNAALAREYGSDRARFADQSIREIKFVFCSGKSPEDRNMRMAKLMAKFISNVYPFQRNNLLWYAAQHIGNYKYIKSLLIHRFRNVEHRFTKEERYKMYEMLK